MVNNDESNIQQAFFQILALNEQKYPQLKWIYAVPNGGYRSITTAKRMKAEGQKSGVWDVCIPISVVDASCAYIEFKAGKNKLTENQEAFRDHLMNQFEYEFAVCRSVEEALAFVEEYLGIELRGSF